MRSLRNGMTSWLCCWTTPQTSPSRTTTDSTLSTTPLFVETQGEWVASTLLSTRTSRHEYAQTSLPRRVEYNRPPSRGVVHRRGVEKDDKGLERSPLRQLRTGQLCVPIYIYILVTDRHNFFRLVIPRIVFFYRSNGILNLFLDIDVEYEFRGFFF